MKLSIRWVFFFGAIILVLGTHFLITPTSYFISELVLSRHMKDIMENVSDLTNQQTTDYLDKAREAVTVSKKLLGTGVLTVDEVGIVSLEKYLYNQLALHPYFSGIYVDDPAGYFLMVKRDDTFGRGGFVTEIIHHDGNNVRVDRIRHDSRFNTLEQKNYFGTDYNPANQPWFNKIMQRKSTCWTDPYILHSAGKPGITLAEPALDPDGTVELIVGIDIELQALSDFFHNIRVGKSGKAFIIDRGGNIIAFHDPSETDETYPDSKHIQLPNIKKIDDACAREAFSSVQWEHNSQNSLQLQKRVLSSFQCSGKKYQAMFTPFQFQEIPWILGMYLPEDDYLGLIRHNRKIGIIATVVIGLIASFFALLVAKNIITPVESLANEARAIEQMDMASNFKVKTRFKELREAAEALARMKSSLISYEGRINESMGLSRAIAKTANDAIIMMNNEHGISFFNPAAERMFGYRENNIMGRHFNCLLASDSNIEQFTNELADSTITGKKPFIDRTINVTAVNRYGTEFPVELSLSSLQIKNKWHAVAIIRDITERKKAEQLRKRLADDLHDGLGGSLTNIKLFAEMTKSHQDMEMVQRNLDVIAGICEDCLVEIRNYMNVLDDIEPQWDTLIAELKQYSTKTLEPYEIKVIVSSDINQGAPNPTRLLYINMQKIVKEAVTNVIKHSDGDALHIVIHVERDRLQCLISDTGTVGRKSDKNGRGLLSMTSRAKEMGGTLDISWGNGVVITLNVPFT